MATVKKATAKAGPQGAAFEPNSGLERKAYAAVAQALGPVLADHYQLFIKTQGVHWNVSGPNFFGLHQLTEQQYSDLYEAIDVVAERIRALGAVAPATYGAYGRMGRIRDEETDGSPDTQVAMLVRDNGLLCETLREALEVAAEHGDVVTEDLLTARLSVHEQNGWMLNMIVS